METFKMLKNEYSDACLSCTNIFEWYRQFHYRKGSVGDNPRVGRSLNSQTPENIVGCAFCFDYRSSVDEPNVGGKTPCGQRNGL